jgi:RNA polymerase sigma-70 factor, ECF subfamily
MPIRIAPSPPQNRVIRDYHEAQDDDLMKLFQAGDDQAFQHLLQRHHGLMWRQVKQILGHVSDFDDIVQDISLSIWQRRKDWQAGQCKFSTWLYRIVTNRCIDYARTKKGKSMCALDDVEILSERQSVEDHISHQQLSGQLKDLLHDLPHQQKLAMQLFYYEDQSVPDIAHALHVSEMAARSLLKRGRQNLRARLEA